jgi:transcriptional regulator with XRE-family HTH domain
MSSAPNGLRQHRTKNGYSERQVAEYLGLASERTVSRWERGEALPSAIQLLRMVALYHATAKELYPDLYKKIEAEMKERMRQHSEKKDGKK